MHHLDEALLRTRMNYRGRKVQPRNSLLRSLNNIKCVLHRRRPPLRSNLQKIDRRTQPQLSTNRTLYNEATSALWPCLGDTVSIWLGLLALVLPSYRAPGRFEIASRALTAKACTRPESIVRCCIHSEHRAAADRRGNCSHQQTT